MEETVFKVHILHLWIANLVPNLWQKCEDLMIMWSQVIAFRNSLRRRLETLNLLHFMAAWHLPVRGRNFFFKVPILHLWIDNLVPNLWQKMLRSHNHVVSSYSLPKFVTTALEALNLLHFIAAWGLPVRGRNIFFKVHILHLWIANLVPNLWQKFEDLMIMWSQVIAFRNSLRRCSRHWICCIL